MMNDYGSFIVLFIIWTYMFGWSLKDISKKITTASLLKIIIASFIIATVVAYIMIFIFLYPPDNKVDLSDLIHDNNIPFSISVNCKTGTDFFVVTDYITCTFKHENPRTKIDSFTDLKASVNYSSCPVDNPASCSETPILKYIPLYNFSFESIESFRIQPPDGQKYLNLSVVLSNESGIVNVINSSEEYRTYSVSNYEQNKSNPKKTNFNYMLIGVFAVLVGVWRYFKKEESN